MTFFRAAPLGQAPDLHLLSALAADNQTKLDVPYVAVGLSTVKGKLGEISGLNFAISGLDPAYLQFQKEKLIIIANQP